MWESLIFNGSSPQLNWISNILYVLKIWFLESGFSIENKNVNFFFGNNIQGWNKINEEKLVKKNFSKLQNMFFFFSIFSYFGTLYNFLLFVSCDLKFYGNVNLSFINHFCASKGNGSTFKECLVVWLLIFKCFEILLFNFLINLFLGDYNFFILNSFFTIFKALDALRWELQFLFGNHKQRISPLKSILL
jgi:hypothetical protein